MYAAVRLFWFGVGGVRPIGDSPFLEGLFKLLVWGGSCLLATMIWARASLHDAWRQLGLHGPVARGWVFGLVATIPMAAGTLVTGAQASDLDDIVGSVLLGPFAEEVLFRGFLFTALWRRARWPWPRALAVSSIAFGLAHLRSLNVWMPVEAILRGYPRWGFEQLADQMPAVVTTGSVFALGGALFGWIYYRWGTLWPAIGIHACMNLWWDLSRGVDHRVTFGLDAAGVAQAMSMVLAVALTLRARSSRAPLNQKFEARR